MKGEFSKVHKNTRKNLGLKKGLIDENSLKPNNCLQVLINLEWPALRTINRLRNMGRTKEKQAKWGLTTDELTNHDRAQILTTYHPIKCPS